MKSIPRPLVRFNQSFIALSALLYLISSQVYFLILPIVFGISSLVLNYNPIIEFSKKFLKKPKNEYIQEDVAQQRFNQMLALTMFVLSFISYYLNIQWLSVTFAIMVFLASTIAILGFCIGCFIHYQFNMWKYRRSLLKA
jgi:hypothetical protein